MVTTFNKRNVELLFGKVFTELPPPSENKEAMTEALQIGNKIFKQTCEMHYDDSVLQIFKRRDGDKQVVLRYTPSAKDDPTTIMCTHGRMVLPWVSLSILPVNGEQEDCLEFYKRLITESENYAKVYIIAYRSKVYKVPAVFIDGLYLHFTKVNHNQLTKTVFIPLSKLRQFANN